MKNVIWMVNQRLCVASIVIHKENQNKGKYEPAALESILSTENEDPEKET